MESWAVSHFCAAGIIPFVPRDNSFFFSFLFFFFLFKHIYHCFPQKHLGLTRVVKILQIYPRFIQVHTQTDTNDRHKLQ